MAENKAMGSKSMIEPVHTEREFCSWLGEALPGEIRRYYRGSLALDLNPHSGRLSDEARGKLIPLAVRARWASDRGLVHLVQRKFGTDDYEYLVVAAYRPSMRSAGTTSFEGSSARVLP